MVITCVVTTRYCLDFGLNLTENDTFMVTMVVTTCGFHLNMEMMCGYHLCGFHPPVVTPWLHTWVVTTRYCLDFGLHLNGNDIFCGNHGNHVVSTFEIMSCPPGNHMVSTWKPHSVHMETTWYVHRNHMVSTWKPCGVHVVTTSCPDGNHVLST